MKLEVGEVGSEVVLILKAKAFYFVDDTICRSHLDTGIYAMFI